jgi:hypothetical protein
LAALYRAIYLINRAPDQSSGCVQGPLHCAADGFAYATYQAARLLKHFAPASYGPSCYIRDFFSGLSD